MLQNHVPCKVDCGLLLDSGYLSALYTHPMSTSSEARQIQRMNLYVHSWSSAISAWLRLGRASAAVRRGAPAEGLVGAALLKALIGRPQLLQGRRRHLDSALICTPAPDTAPPIAGLVLNLTPAISSSSNALGSIQAAYLKRSADAGKAPAASVHYEGQAQISKVPESKHALCFYLPLQRSAGVEGIVLGRVFCWSLHMFVQTVLYCSHSS